MESIPIHPDMMRTNTLFEPGHTLAREWLSGFSWPWEALPGICGFITETGAALDKREYDILPDNVWIHKTAVIAPSAYIGANIVICANAVVRHCAFVRENVMVGESAVVGNSTELKNVILFDGVQVPHYNYVGDSILGYRSHMGAGAITSNVKSDHTPISVTCGDKRIETGLKKFGAILGDYVEIGCNAVLNPGSVIGPHTTVYPLSLLRGFVPAGCICKKPGDIVKKR